MSQPAPNRGIVMDFGARGAAGQPLRRTALNMARKVPEITVYFWIIKLLTTAMGEATSDYLVFGINPYVAVILGAAGLGVALTLQLAVRRYIAWVYWLAIVMVAIFGTMAADVLHVVILAPRLGANLAYVVATVFFSTCLAIVFTTWHAVEKTLSIHSIYTRRRELFYWATIMATFALGTAAGDLTAFTFGLGYFPSAVLYYVLIALPAVGYVVFGLNEIFAFWFAYVVTRPLGASIADWLSKPYLTGLGLGDRPVAVVLAILIIGFVAFLSISRIDVYRGAGRPPDRH
jgi:uncharacterized membrane-anchored protein